MSSMCSMPTARRTSPGVTPEKACSSGVSWLCVVDAGWMTSERTSPMFATCECSSSAETNACPAAEPPSISNASTAPAPRGVYFLAASCHGLGGRPAYAGLPSSPWHEAAKKYTPRGAGAVLAFEIEGGSAAGQAFVSALELHSHVANIGDVRSLVIHPASTTHSQLTPEEQALSGVTPGLVRLSVGIENIEDILADLDAGFRAAKGA